MTIKQKTAITTLLQVVDKLTYQQLEAALEKIDLDTETFNEDVNILKDIVEWDS